MSRTLFVDEHKKKKDLKKNVCDFKSSGLKSSSFSSIMKTCFSKKIKELFINAFADISSRRMREFFSSQYVSFLYLTHCSSSKLREKKRD